MSTDEERVVRHYWIVAEELWTQQLPVAAISVLEGLLQRPIPASLVEDEVQTRLRLAEMILSESLHPELARRVLEPARALARHHSVGTISRVELLRLLSICARRKHHHKLSVSCLDEALKQLGEERKRKGVLAPSLSAAEALVYLELSRTWYARLVDCNFSDQDAAVQLIRVSGGYNAYALQPLTASAAITLCVCHIYGLLCCSRHSEVVATIQQATAIFGAMSEFTVLKGLVEFMYTDAGPSAVMGSDVSSGSHSVLAETSLSSPLRKRVRSDGCDSSPAHGVDDPSQHGVMWLSEGALFANDLLMDLLRLGSKMGSSMALSLPTGGPAGSSSTVSPTLVEQKFTTLVSTVEDQMKRVMAAKNATTGAPNLSLNSELRFLVAVKICAFCEVIALDLTRLNLTSAAAKLGALCRYLVLFQKHSRHFMYNAHVLIGVFFAIVATCAAETDDGGANVASALVHFQHAVDNAADPFSLIFVKIIRCSMWLNLALQMKQKQNAPTESYQKRIDLMRHIHAALDELKESYNEHGDRWTPRLKAMMLLLCGTLSVDEYDYASAIQHFKSAAEIARKVLGMSTPLLSSALRLLAMAHHLAGATEASDVALTTATQLSTRNHDESCMVLCMEWTLGRMVIGCDADVKHRDQLLRSMRASAEHLAVQMAHAATTEETQRLRTFVSQNVPAKEI